MLLCGACVEIDEVTYEAEVWGCSARTTQGTCGGASNKHCYWDTTTPKCIKRTDDKVISSLNCGRFS